MKKNIKHIIRNINKKLLQYRERIHKERIVFHGGMNLDGGAPDDAAIEKLEKQKEELEKLQKQKEGALEKKISERLQKEQRKAELIESAYNGLELVLDDPTAACEQMDTILATAMNVKPEDIKKGAELVYKILEKVDVEEIMSEAKDIAEKAKILTQGTSDPDSDTGKLLAEGQELASQLKADEAIQTVKDAASQAASAVAPQAQEALASAKETAAQVKAQIGDVKNIADDVKGAVGTAKGVATDLLKQIPPEDVQSAVNAASTAAKAVAALAGSPEVKQIMDTLGTVAGALQPVLELGAAIPGLGIALSVVNKLMVQLKASQELKDILEDMRDGIQNSLLLIKLIKATMGIYKLDTACYYSAQNKLLVEKIQKAKGKDKVRLKAAAKSLTKEISYLYKIQLKATIESKVSDKVQTLVDLLKRLIGETESAPTESKGVLSSIYNSAKRFVSKAKAFYNRFGMAQYYQKEILKNLNIINNLLIIYNSQFDWAQGSFIMRLKNKKIGKEKMLDVIWTKIESTEEFKNYLWKDDAGENADAAAIKGGRKTYKKTNRRNHKTHRIR
jgi:hypothetical protein